VFCFVFFVCGVCFCVGGSGVGGVVFSLVVASGMVWINGRDRGGCSVLEWGGGKGVVEQ